MTGLQQEGIIHVQGLCEPAIFGSLYDVQRGSDFNTWETLTHTVNCPKELAIYGPGPDLCSLNFGP